MGLQKFKMSIANTVISQENASLQSMGTDQLLDLFTLDKVWSALVNFAGYNCPYLDWITQAVVCYKLTQNYLVLFILSAF